jgi:predicted secreted protein
MKAARWSVVALAVLVIAGCGQIHRQSHVRTLHLTWKDNRGGFTVKPHETIVLTLSFTRHAGYQWRFSPASQAMLGFRQLSQRYVAPKNGVHGAMGKEIWRYRPVGMGGANLGVYYGKLNSRHTRWIMARRFDVGIGTS